MQLYCQFLYKSRIFIVSEELMQKENTIPYLLAIV